jgi:hypothetical protein
MEERRRCPRLPLAIPVKIYGRTPRNHPFRDVTASMTVSLYGGLLKMRPRVKIGQSLLVVNSFTQEERVCRVVSIDRNQRGRMNVAVEFAQAGSDFWHVYGPAVALKPAAPRRAAAEQKASPESVPALAQR